MGIERIEHFMLLSDDIDATRDFYCRALGLSAGERPPLAFPGYWLYADGRALVHIADRGCYSAHAASIGLDVAATGGAVMRIDHIAFAATDYVDAAERLERGGIEILGAAGRVVSSNFKHGLQLHGGVHRQADHA